MMTLLKALNLSLLVLVASTATFTQAAPISSGSVVLPTLIVMAEPELRAMTEIIPYQEEASQRDALNRYLMKVERDIQSYSVDADFAGSIDVVRAAPKPDLDSLPVVFREYVLVVAAGLQSADPRKGLYTILQPFGIDANATTVQIVREQFHPNQLNISLPFTFR